MMSEPQTNDAPLFQLQGLPLCITHSSFFISQRKLAISRKSGVGLDTRQGESAGRRIGEVIEKTLIGTNQGITYGGASTQTGGYGRNSTVYGYTNFTPRLTYTSVTTPTGSNPEATLANVLAMLDLLKGNKFYGPFMLYHSNDWDRFMDNDYQRLVSGSNSIGGSLTLRNRLRMIDDIIDVRRLDMLFSANVPTDTTSGSYRGPGGEGFTATGTSPYTLLLVQMTEDVARAVNGLDITTIMWESMGGARLNFRVIAIQVPQLRADAYGNVGIAHGTTA